MQLFKRILKEPEAESSAAEAVREERRSRQRLTINPKFPLKAVLNFVGRDDQGEFLSNNPIGWDWKGRLVNFSELGARMQLGPKVNVKQGETCELKLSLDTFHLAIPCRTSNIRAEPEGVFIGLKLALTDEASATAYRQLLDTVALGVTLKPEFKKTKTDESGYLTEQYASPHLSRLTIWRHHPEKTVAAFELVLRDCLVRAADEHSIEYLAGASAKEAQRTSGVRLWEIQRLFQWVVPNLAPAVPTDVKLFLQSYVT